VKTTACIVVFLCLGLAACMGAPPVSVHPLETFGRDEKYGIVLIDLDLETSTSMINSSTLILPSRPTREVFAIYADVGEEFRLKRLSVPANPGYSADLTFPGAKSLLVSRAGIYYYGRVVQRGANVSVDYDVRNDVIARARAKYPNMFAVMPAENFQK
jgi:hypothetical protein